MTEKLMTPRSSHVPRRHAATTPSGTASETARISVHVASASVGWRRPVMSSATGFLKKNDSPKSPCTTLPIQMKNCCTIGWSSPSFVRIASTSAEVALSPAMIAAGSPVVSRRRRKTVMATTAITGMVASSRRTMYPSTTAAPSLLALLLDVPEHGRRRLDVAGDVLADRRRAVPLAERQVRRVLRRADLRLLGDLLLLGRVRLTRER